MMTNSDLVMIAAIVVRMHKGTNPSIMPVFIEYSTAATTSK